jgi:hypothetical protein
MLMDLRFMLGNVTPNGFGSGPAVGQHISFGTVMPDNNTPDGFGPEPVTKDNVRDGNSPAYAQVWRIR